MTFARLTWALGALVAVVAIAISSLDPGLTARARDMLHDVYQRADPRPYDPEAPVHIIDINQDALDSYGQWPWPRSYLARLNDTLAAHGAAVIGYDILFPEPDRTSPENITDSWARFDGPEVGLPDLPRHDDMFAAAIAAWPTVLAFAGGPDGDVITPKAGIAFTGDDPSRHLTGYPAALANQSVLQDAALGLGNISLGRSADGIVRSVPMVVTVQGGKLPAFSAELLRVAQGAGGYVLRTSQASGEMSGNTSVPTAIGIGDFGAPLNPVGELRVYFSGSQVQRITPIAEVLETDGLSPTLQVKVGGKIVIIGSSAQGLFDIRKSPLADYVPGVELHAEVLEQIFAGQFLTRPDWARGAEVLTILFFCLCLSIVLVQQRPVLSLAATIVLITFAVLAGSTAFRNGLLLDPIWPVLAVVMLYLPGTTIGIIAKERARRLIRSRFAYFLPPDLLAQVIDDPEDTLTPQGADRDMTVMFVDMRDFTSVTENLAPSDVVDLVNTYLSGVSDALVAEGATIDKYIGDAIMAFWNAPIEVPDHAQQALTAISNITDAVGGINESLARKGLPQVRVAIGINSGPCQVGLMGSRDRLSYTCIGDNVTLAARLEGLTRIYGVGNCVGPTSAVSLPDGTIAPVLDVVQVKGKTIGIAVHTLAKATDANLKTAAALQNAREAFLEQNWQVARERFAALAEAELEGHSLAPLAALYLQRIGAFEATPPPADWDGVFAATSKR